MMPEPSILLVLALVLPVAGLLLALVAGGRHAGRIALLLTPVGLAVAVAIVVGVVRADDALVYHLGGWAPPLGVALRADGLSAILLLTTAAIIGATGWFARAEFRPAPGQVEGRASLAFWTLLLALWGAMNLVCLGNDLFTLFVALELLTFSAVPLVCLDGRAGTLEAALRYLLFALFGSVLYLLGVVLLYGAYGTLDIGLLSGLIQREPIALAAAALMTVGLLAKTALFPLHLWLPPAHAGAPAAASAVLSALVVKASLFLIVRLWFDVMPELMNPTAAQVLGALGAAAILFGGVLALRQARLKMLIAYSTVAQIGYLFLVFPLITRPESIPLAAADLATELVALEVTTSAWSGGVLQAVSHAFAKAAMFLAAGLIAQRLGHDRIADLGGIGRALPITVLAFGLAGMSLMGLPPSGGFAAKWLLLVATIETGQWWWSLVILGGGLLTGGYLFRVLAPVLAGASEPVTLRAPVARDRELVVLALALCSVLLGFVRLGAFDLVQIGRLTAAGMGLP